MLRRLLVSGQVRSAMVTDAQLAALALENGGELYSTDRDFWRFKQLRWSNPLDWSNQQQQREAARFYGPTDK